MNEAARPPVRSRVAAIPVPVPRTGPGKLSGVKANMTAYSVWNESVSRYYTNILTRR